MLKENFNELHANLLVVARAKFTKQLRPRLSGISRPGIGSGKNSQTYNIAPEWKLAPPQKRERIIALTALRTRDEELESIQLNGSLGIFRYLLRNPAA